MIIENFLDARNPPLSKKTKALLKSYLSVVELPKKQVLVDEGQVSTKMYWMVKGASRSYYISKGIEVHTWFALENEVLGSLRNFNTQPSRETIELVEDSVLIAFDIEGLKRLQEDNSEVNDFVNKAIFEYALFLEDRFFLLHMKSAREKFDSLMELEPEIFNRIPLSYIASYLGITRETLSRLRAE